MTEPDAKSLEGRALQTLNDAVKKHLDAADLPLHTMAAQGTPDGNALKTLLAQDTTAPSATPAAATRGGQHSRRPVSEMSAADKLVEAFNRADISDAVRARILAALAPQQLAGAILTFATVFVASQFTPVGWVEDVALGLTAVFVGSALFRAAQHLIDFAGAAHATSDEQLTAAGHAFAQACAELEVDALLFMIAKAAGGPGGGPPTNATASANMVLATRNGQLVIVAVDSVPAHIAAEWGITGAGAVSAMAMTGPGGDGAQPPRDGSGRGSAGPAKPPPKKVTEAEMIQAIRNSPKRPLGKVDPPAHWPASADDGIVMHERIAAFLQRVMPNPRMSYKTKGPDMPEEGTDFAIEIKPDTDSGIATFVRNQWGVKQEWSKRFQLVTYDQDGNVYEIDFPAQTGPYPPP